MCRDIVGHGIDLLEFSNTWLLETWRHEGVERV